MRLFALLAGVLVLTAAVPPAWKTLRTDGVSVRYPPTWHATTRQLTLVDDPPQVLAVASYRFPRDTRPNGCNPEGTLAAMPPTGALIVVIEYAGSVPLRNFPLRPAHLRLRSARTYECFGPPRHSYLLRFRDHERLFQAQVAFWRAAHADRRATVLRILDSLEVRAR